MSAPTTPALLPPLATLGDLEAHLGHPVDPVAGAAALDAASSWVRAVCGWSISQQVGVTFTVDGSGTSVLDLPTLWLVDVHAVRLRGKDLVNDPDDRDGYDWSRAGQLFRDAGWPCRPRAVATDVTHGFDPVPAALVGIVCAMSGRQVENPSGVRMQTVGTVIEQFHDPGAIANAVRGGFDVLEMFTIPPRP